MKKLTTIVLIAAYIAYIPAQVSYAASKIVITNNSNGTESENTAEAEFVSTVVVEQENTVQVENVVEQEANTGGNEVTDNNGDVEVITGDITTTTEVENTVGDNQAVVFIGPLPMDGVVENTQNGRNSDNDIQIEVETVKDVEQVNTVDVLNKTEKDLNTGYNTAKDNNGDVTIKSGDIVEHTKFDTTSGDNNIEIEKDSNVTLDIKNEQNGRDSENNIGFALSEVVELTQDNAVEVENIENKDLNTGENECKDSQGECYIESGDIKSVTDVTTKTGSNSIVVGHPPVGGPIDDPASDPTPTPEKPNGGVVFEEDPSVEEPAEQPEEEKSVLEEIIEKIIPPAFAQVAEMVEDPQDEDGKVNSAMTLPTTGLGELPHVSWLEVLFGADLLALGYLLRRKFAKASVSTN